MMSTAPAFSNNFAKKFIHLAMLMCCSAAVVPPSQAGADPAQPVAELVRRFTEAQREMDVATLKALTAEQYIEVSPLGEVDHREKMLTFYAKDGGRPAPTALIEESVTRMLGETAIVIAKVSYSTVVEGQKRSFSLRSSFVAQKLNGDWKLVSAHYTAIRPKNPG